LTNSVLENLKSATFLLENDVVKKADDADLISKYAIDILQELISASEDDSLIPSWMTRMLLKEKTDQKIALLHAARMTYETSIKSAEAKIHQLNQARAMRSEKLQKISAARNSRLQFILFSALSLGYYAYINSKKRLELLTAQLEESEQSIPPQIDSLTQEIAHNTYQLARNGEDIEKVKTSHLEKASQVMTLTENAADSTAFTPMKNLPGLDYEKIKGVYIIRNRELDKFYVGQSKDVMKRLKDHFTGTEPKNIIFAEDYYNSNLSNKSELFEFKIETLETKDELDKREMELIAEYDSFNNGYNKTAGNS